ncbi:c-type cytochrome domain-containing protein [Flagellimonas sp. S3867]|uniref:c-type cytochrome domain-containing protein n=1 Tax=Flagellimonas sp. S3867 TaxID=2768063 RepID=UPI001687CABA|nr:c-type cytochrome domain-containing protein [Flagellimonas sp. S3867]
MDILKQFLGRLHPILVHLPIGFIILGLLLQWYDRKIRAHSKIIALIFLWAGILSAFACVTGYLQYLGEGYAFDTVKWHLWLGITTTIFCFLMYSKISEKPILVFLKKFPILLFSSLLFVLISFTGHLGGDITHGKGYLLEPFPNSVKSFFGHEIFEEKPIVLNEENWENSLFYEDVIHPLINNKCVSCHNPKKSKGELKLHSLEDMLVGGENGEIIVENNPSESPLYSRLILSKDDEDHMPPKEKTQLTKEEITLIKTWILHGNPSNKTIGHLGLQKELFLSFFPQKENKIYPDTTIAAAPSDSIAHIKMFGLHVQQISNVSTFLSVSSINKPSFSNSDFEILNPILKHIVVLDLGGTQVTDDIFDKLTSLPHLTTLKLDDTSITGDGIELLSQLKYLKSINLTHTDFGDSFIPLLKEFKALEKVYLYNTKANPKDWQRLKENQTVLDYGNYELPKIAADSIIY